MSDLEYAVIGLWVGMLIVGPAIIFVWIRCTTPKARP